MDVHYILSGAHEWPLFSVAISAGPSDKWKLSGGLKGLNFNVICVGMLVFQ
jgi:hypothetical protein